jgi:hypothetical protein
MRLPALPFHGASGNIRRAMVDPHSHYRPYSSSCPRCHRQLDLAAVREGGTWYCSAACARGRPGPAPERSVPAPRLTNRPRRFFGRRPPKELRRPAGD